MGGARSGSAWALAQDERRTFAYSCVVSPTRHDDTTEASVIATSRSVRALLSEVVEEPTQVLVEPVTHSAAPATKSVPSSSSGWMSTAADAAGPAVDRGGVRLAEVEQDGRRAMEQFVDPSRALRRVEIEVEVGQSAARAVGARARLVHDEQFGRRLVRGSVVVIGCRAGDLRPRVVQHARPDRMALVVVGAEQAAG